jgi:hypothetical protein
MLAVLAGLVLATTGCIKLEQSLTINKDGSAALDVSYGMAEATILQMQQMSQMGDPGEKKEDKNDFEFDEAKVKSKLAALEKDGVVVKSVATSVKDGWKYMNIKLEGKSIAALKKTEFLNEMSLAKDDKGNYVLQMNDKKDKAAGGDEMNEQMMAQMGPMFAGFRAVMKVKVPGKIVETDAGEKTDDTATWTYDMEKDPKALMKAEKDHAKIVFAAPGVTLPVLKGGKEDIAPPASK